MEARCMRVGYETELQPRKVAGSQQGYEVQRGR